MIGYKSFLLGFLFISLSLISGACSEEVNSSGKNESSPPFRIGGKIKGVNSTKGYLVSGPVDEGDFYLTYFNMDAKHDLALVEFFDGVGAVTKNGTALEWPGIGFDSDSQTISTFYLDNVPGNSFPEDGLVTFTQTYNPFVAGELDMIDGTNDLLWGMRQISRNSPVVNFELEHCMSLLNLEVKLDEALNVAIEELDIDNATVTITNLQHKAEKFNRLTGELLLPSQADYQPLAMVNENHDWAHHSEEINGDTKTLTYLSKDFVLPPQDLLTTEDRPRFSITFPGKNGGDGITYSGMIPRTMEMQQPDRTIIPMTLSLLRGQEMTIHVRISQDPLEIIFLPVTVVDWVNKGTFMLGVNQAGLDENSDLGGLIEALKSGKEENISRYGYKQEDKWIINVFCDLAFTLEEVKNQLNGIRIPFAFKMHKWTITIKDEESSVSYELTNSDQFVDLLTNGNLPSLNS